MLLKYPAFSPVDHLDLVGLGVHSCRWMNLFSIAPLFLSIALFLLYHVVFCLCGWCWMRVVPSDYFVSTQLQFWLCCCWVETIWNLSKDNCFDFFCFNKVRKRLLVKFHFQTILLPHNHWIQYKSDRCNNILSKSQCCSQFPENNQVS